MSHDTSSQPNDQGTTGTHPNDRRAILFKRLFSLLPQLNVLSALTATASIGALTFDEFHQTSSSSMNHAAEGLLTSCAVAATTSIMLSTMLMFRFEAHESILRREYMLLWTPLILLDWSIVALLVGVTLWYVEKNDVWRAAVMVAQVGGLLGFSSWVAVRVAVTMRREGGIGA
ncbi:hypothetical protein UCDDS831_g08679 [Diplodia seriata]|uniref:Uncharacterized protein n=1 Tax=Diplodia seriata TaxID=420778 RepID=A0A0G2DT53_9PEZI|nr:hypothetical protein UCDDS831_g08679 [Diplodia seriata]